VTTEFLRKLLEEADLKVVVRRWAPGDPNPNIETKDAAMTEFDLNAALRAHSDFHWDTDKSLLSCPCGWRKFHWSGFTPQRSNIERAAREHQQKAFFESFPLHFDSDRMLPG
jgi:hypothetical protein